MTQTKLETGPLEGEVVPTVSGQWSWKITHKGELRCAGAGYDNRDDAMGDMLNAFEEECALLTLRIREAGT